MMPQRQYHEAMPPGSYQSCRAAEALTAGLPAHSAADTISRKTVIPPELPMTRDTNCYPSS